MRMAASLSPKPCRAEAIVLGPAMVVEAEGNKKKEKMKKIKEVQRHDWEEGGHSLVCKRPHWDKDMHEKGCTAYDEYKATPY